MLKPVEIRHWKQNEESFSCPVCVYYSQDLNPIANEKDMFYCSECGKSYQIKITGKTVLQKLGL